MQASKQIEQEYWRLVRESVNLRRVLKSSFPIHYVLLFLCIISQWTTYMYSG